MAGIIYELHKYIYIGEKSFGFEEKEREIERMVEVVAAVGSPLVLMLCSILQWFAVLCGFCFRFCLLSFTAYKFLIDYSSTVRCGTSSPAVHASIFARFSLLSDCCWFNCDDVTRRTVPMIKNRWLTHLPHYLAQFCFFFETMCLWGMLTCLLLSACLPVAVDGHISFRLEYWLSDWLPLRLLICRTIVLFLFDCSSIYSIHCKHITATLNFML